MVLDMLIYVQLSQEDKTMQKLTNLSTLCCNIEKTPIFTGLFQIFNSIIL